MIRLIHPRFQGKIMAFGALIGALCLGLVYLGNSYFFAQTRAALLAGGLTEDHAIFLLLGQMQSAMGIVFAVSLGLALAVSVVVGTLLSAKVARPLDLMRRHFIAASRGAMPSRLHFRKTDFFQEVADAYNQELESRGLVPGRDPRATFKIE